MAAQLQPVSYEANPQQSVPARDRLLAALASAPRLTDEDAAQINRAIQEARETSIADGLSNRH